MELNVGDRVKYRDNFLAKLTDITERNAKQQWNGVIVPRALGALPGFVHVNWVDHNGTTIDLYHYPFDLELMAHIIKPLTQFGKVLPAYLQPGPPAGSGFSKEYYECTDCGYINYDGYKKETNKESLGKGFICPQCGGLELNPLEDNPPMSARDRYATYDSDNIRKQYILQAIESKEHDMEITKEDLLESPDWVIVLNKRNGILEYNEYWGKPCWDALYQKKEYKGLVKEDAIKKFMDERFQQLITSMDGIIDSWTFSDNILRVEISIFSNKLAQRDVRINEHNWSFDMENGEIKLSLGNLSDAGWFWDGDASDLNGFLVRISTSEVKNVFIAKMEEKEISLQALKAHIIESINNGSGVYEISGDNNNWQFGHMDPDLNGELEDIEGLTDKDKGEIEDLFWDYFEIKFDDFYENYGQIFRDEFTERLNGSNTIKNYLDNLVDMEQLGVQEYGEYEMFVIADAMIRAKEKWENKRMPKVKPLEHFG